MSAKIQTGDVFKTDLGETIEITNERGDEVCVYYPDREPVEGSAKTHWRPRETVETQIEHEDMERISGEPGDEGRLNGTFHGPVRCPKCSRFMSTGYDGEGFPVAQCSRASCNGVKDVDDLIQSGEWEEQ